MALKDWSKQISGTSSGEISYYKDNKEVRIVYDYSLLIWKIMLLESQEYSGQIGRTTMGGLKGKKDAIKIAKSYMRSH